MDEEIERLVVAVRADTSGFARDVSEMRAQLDGPLADSAARAGRVIESVLLQVARTGKLSFEDLKRVALQAMSEIATSAIRSGIGVILGEIGLGSSGGRGGSGTGGAPGRAIGGPVSPGRPYLVGERGPELFVPTSAGQVAAPVRGSGGDVRVTVNIATPVGADAAQALTRSSRQIARAVRRAID